MSQHPGRILRNSIFRVLYSKDLYSLYSGDLYMYYFLQLNDLYLESFYIVTSLYTLNDLQEVIYVLYSLYSEDLYIYFFLQLNILHLESFYIVTSLYTLSSIKLYSELTFENDKRPNTLGISQKSDVYLCSIVIFEANRLSRISSSHCSWALVVFLNSQVILCSKCSNELRFQNVPIPR